MKTSKKIRREFIEFFEKKQHTFVPSSPVVPRDDPTLLFTNAGMNQFKDVFLGIGKRDYTRAVNSQKCIRVSGKHNDLEEVGHDTYHHTFFEMLGNWSFGDYFKKEAIRWAWELLTDVWKLPKDQLWATVFAGDPGDGLDPDTEAESLWESETDIPPEHILRFDKKDNFWEMGETGPCGPCSEIHIDLGPAHCDKQKLKGHTCQVNGDCARYIEIWNLVFIQYNRDKSGALNALPARHVDTGMGFERVVAVLQKVRSNYDTDLFQPILKRIGELCGLVYANADEEQQIAFRVIADHIRMLTFSITDGALPSNEGQGYVLRRILRRAARYARKLGMKEPFIYQLVETVVAVMGEAFPEIQEKAPYTMEVIKSEEENFNRTLDRGLEKFSQTVQKLRKEKKKILPGEEVFRLYDTYGFPADLTRILAAEQNLQIDEDGFNRAMDAQRERGRKAGKFSPQMNRSAEWIDVVPGKNSSKFLGYDRLETETVVRKFLKSGAEYRLILAETPFYAESGGQLGDRGTIEGPNFRLNVVDTRKEGGEIVHICTSDREVEFTDGKVVARVKRKWRLPTMYNHTATHLLHAALRKVLGEHVHQAGSLVAPERLRFDFTHFKKIDADQLKEIEWLVNRKIQEDLPVETTEMDFSEAKKAGAMALFGEKYGDRVRVVSVADYSKELCGGTHVRHTGQIGSMLITQETGIASGVRRIEAITGPEAVAAAQKWRDNNFRLAQLLNCPPEQIVQSVAELQEHLRKFEKELRQAKSGQVLQQVDDLLNQAEEINGVKLVIREFSDVPVDVLKQLGDLLRQKAKNAVGFFINKSGDRLNFVCAVTDELISTKRLKAGDIVREAAKIAGGGGGGRPHLATAGAKNAAKLPQVIDYIRRVLSALT